MGKKSYAEKLKDPRWQRRRLVVLERDKWQCQKCGHKDRPLHVHHEKYRAEKDPWEYEIDELTTVCDECHDFIFEKKKALTRLGGLLDMAGEDMVIQLSDALLDFVTQFDTEDGELANNLPTIFAAFMWSLIEKRMRVFMVEAYCADPNPINAEVLEDWLPSNQNAEKK